MSTKKEDRNAYKQMKLRVGIFQIKNLKNDKLFLKTCMDLDRAFGSDLFQLNTGLHSNSELQNDWKTLGADSFEFNIFDELKMKDNANDIEIRRELKEFLNLHRSDLLAKGYLLY